MFFVYSLITKLYFLYHLICLIEILHIRYFLANIFLFTLSFNLDSFSSCSINIFTSSFCASLRGENLPTILWLTNAFIFLSNGWQFSYHKILSCLSFLEFRQCPGKVFWYLLLLMRQNILIKLSYFCRKCHFSLTYLKIFISPLVFYNFTLICWVWLYFSLIGLVHRVYIWFGDS